MRSWRFPEPMSAVPSDRIAANHLPMTTRSTLERVGACMQVALQLTDAETVAIAADATPLTVRGWTSLAHVQLILELERHFGITFDADDIATLASVSSIVAAVEQKQQ